MSALNEKYLEILEKGKELFWKYGLKRVTINEICTVAGISRVTFYKYFKNKENLAWVILDDMMKSSLREYKDIMNSEISFKKKVEETILLKMKSSGEMSHEFLNDVMSGDFPELVELISKTRMETMARIEADYRKAGSQGLIRKGIRIEFIMYYLNKLQDFVYDPVLETYYQDSGELIKEMVNFFFYGLLPRDNSSE